MLLLHDQITNEPKGFDQPSVALLPGSDKPSQRAWLSACKCKTSCFSSLPCKSERKPPAVTLMYKRVAKFCLNGGNSHSGQVQKSSGIESQRQQNNPNLGHNQAFRVGQFSVQNLGQFWVQINRWSISCEKMSLPTYMICPQGNPKGNMLASE